MGDTSPKLRHLTDESLGNAVGSMINSSLYEIDAETALFTRHVLLQCLERPTVSRGCRIDYRLHGLRKLHAGGTSGLESKETRSLVPRRIVSANFHLPHRTESGTRQKIYGRELRTSRRVHSDSKARKSFFRREFG